MYVVIWLACGYIPLHSFLPFLVCASCNFLMPFFLSLDIPVLPQAKKEKKEKKEKKTKKE